MNSSTPLARFGLAALVAACGVGPSIAAQDTSEVVDEALLNRFTINGRLGFGYKASFRNLSPRFFSATDFGPATGGAVDRQYLNGYVKVDSSGNKDNLTWNFGYNSPSQILQETDEIAFNSVSGNLSVDTDDSPKSLPIGVELGYERHFGKLGRLPWGFFGSVSWSDVEVKDSTTLPVPLDLTTDRYSLGGIEVPLQDLGGGYNGTFSGEGALIGSEPTRTTSTIFARTEGGRRMVATLIGLKLGPSLEIPVSRRLAVNLSAGLAAAFVDGEFAYAERVLYTDATGATVSFPPTGGEASKSEFEVGAYVHARVGLQGTGLFFGVAYQYLPDYKITAGGKEATLELGQTFFIEAGISFGF